MKFLIAALLVLVAIPAWAENWITNGDFSAWQGADSKASCDTGFESASAIHIGPGLGGCTSAQRLSPCSGDGTDGYCLMLNLYRQPWGGGDPRTTRLTILEHHIQDGGTLAGQRVRLSFNVLTSRRMGLIPILWQNWRPGVYQIYTCPTVENSHTAWVRAVCDMVLPYTSAIPLQGAYTGVGLDLETPITGVVILDDLRLERVP